MKKILIIRFSSIGDIVLTTPVVRCLKKQLPDVEIHYLIKERFYPIIKANPYISKIHTFKEDLAPVIKSLKRESFDFIVDLHKNLRSGRVKMTLKKPSGTFNKLNSQKWLMVNLHIDRLPNQHIVDRYFKAVKPLGVNNDHEGLEYFVPDDDRLGMEDLPESHRNGYFAFVIGGMHYTKMLPEEKVIELCNMIDRPIILLGGNDDMTAANRIIEKAKGEIYNGCGQYTVNQSASVISMADKVITNDTGMMHIAAAYHKDIISFWGNTIPGFGMYPYLPTDEGSSSIMEVKGLSCRPCSKIGYDRCPKKHFRCMMDIDLNTVLEKIKA